MITNTNKPMVAIAFVFLARSVFAAQATTSPSAMEIRAVAHAIVDPTTPFERSMVDQLVINSPIEREFATEMLKSMRAEHAMFVRSAVAMTGEENGFLVQTVIAGVAQGKQSIDANTPKIEQDTATLEFSQGGAATTLHFKRTEGRWRLDLLRRYREREQIDAEGVMLCKAKQKAAEEVTGMYERKQATNILQLRALYSE